MIAPRDIHWLAGLLEGEGCFVIGQHSQTRHKYPRIQLDMTDNDVVEKAARFLKPTSVNTLQPSMPNAKVSYRFAVNGQRAIGWMMTLYPLMGERRQVRIRECLNAWRSSTARSYKRKGT